MLELISYFAVITLLMVAYMSYRYFRDNEFAYLLDTIREDVINLHVISQRIIDQAKK
jgi:hypothetical protein